MREREKTAESLTGQASNKIGRGKKESYIKSFAVEVKTNMIKVEEKERETNIKV